MTKTPFKPRVIKGGLKDTTAHVQVETHRLRALTDYLKEGQASGVLNDKLLRVMLDHIKSNMSDYIAFKPVGER